MYVCMLAQHIIRLYILFCKRSNHAVYHQLIECTDDSVKQNEESQDRPPTQQEEAYRGLLIYSYYRLPLYSIKMNL